MLQTMFKMLLLVTIVSGTIVAIGSAPTVAATKSDKIEPRLQQIFDTELCPKLNGIVGAQKLVGETCNVSYAKKSDQDRAANKICNKYGKQLKSQCNAYKNYKAGTPAKKTAKPGETAAGKDPVYGNNDKCGTGDSEVKTSINIGCQGKGNAIIDMLFAFIRFLSAGVGLIIVGSLVFAGIQYTTSRGDPQATAAAIDRIQNSLLALLLFIFAYAILNYIVPGAVLR